MRTPVAAAIVLILLLAAPADAQTRVTRSGSSTVRLQAGARAVPLTLEGQDMTSVSRVRVLLNGRPATGVTAVVKQATAAQIVVELTADAGVQAGNYTIELVAGRQHIAVPTSIVSIAIARSRTRLMPRRTVEPAPLPQRPVAAQAIPIPSPAITNATPATVQLRAGGPPATVVLNGTLLNRVRRARVQRDGRTLSSVRAQLIGTTPTRLEVQLTATASAGPPWNSPLDLVLEYTLGSSPVAAQDPMATPVHITVAAPPPVDLSITACGAMQNDNPREARITIRNTGSEGAAFQSRQLIASVTVRGRTFDVIATGGGMFIPSGATVDVTGYIDQQPEGTTSLAWTVDPADLIPESNPSNNSRNCTVNVAAPPPSPVAPLPDLVIPVMSITPNAGPAGTAFVVRIYVRNVGPGTAPADISQLVRCMLDGAVFSGTQRNAPYRTLTTDMSVVHEITINSTNFVPGTKTLECSVDDGNLRPETVDDNNTRAITFRVTER